MVGVKKDFKAITVSRILIFSFFILGLHGESEIGLVPRCHYPAIFNFGDSNSDTGAISAAFLRVPPPNGETFFHKPSGRVCDGRLLIDFIAEKLTLPYLNAYLDSIGTSFYQGANFATAGSTIRPQNTSFLFGAFSPFSLNIQVRQFLQFKARTNELYNEGTSPFISNFPNPEEFSKSLYTFDIGQNDLAAGFRSMSDDQVRETIPDILNQFSLAIQEIYNQGARVFWIHNTGPVGCLPYSVMFYPFKPGNLDENGCVRPQNEVAQDFNRQLKDRVTQLRQQLPSASLIYVDVYSTKYGLISEAKEQGFIDPLKFCSGNASCGNPSKYISWDGIHYSEAANRWIANHILNGSLSDPPSSITQACHKSMH